MNKELDNEYIRLQNNITLELYSKMFDKYYDNAFNEINGKKNLALIYYGMQNNCYGYPDLIEQLNNDFGKFFDKIYEERKELSSKEIEELKNTCDENFLNSAMENSAYIYEIGDTETDLIDFISDSLFEWYDETTIDLLNNYIDWESLSYDLIDEYGIIEFDNTWWKTDLYA